VWDGIHRNGFYDSDLNRIESANWMLHGEQYATGFTLWDFDQSGIPAIEITYWGAWQGLWPTSPNNSLFVFDGYEYRRVAIRMHEDAIVWRQEYHRDMYEWVHIYPPFYNSVEMNYPFFDPDGNLIFYRPPVENFYATYFYVIFEENIAEFQRIASLNAEHLYTAPWFKFTWTNYLTGETNIGITEFPSNLIVWDDAIQRIQPYENHYLPGTNSWLTLIHPLIGLQSEIYETVRQRLLSE